MSRSPIYLDHHATTPLDRRVLKAMYPYLNMKTGLYGNEASGHEMNARVEKAVTKAREQVARLIDASAEEIIFTSGATESNNLALCGWVEKLDQSQRFLYLLTSSIEHSSVLEPSAYLNDTHISIRKLDRVDPKDMAEVTFSTDKDTFLMLSFMYANNETGQLLDIESISQAAHDRGGDQNLFHVDAAQGVSHNGGFSARRLPHVHLASLSAHKIYGPKGVGALYVRKGYRRWLEPMLRGGGHEEGLRPGTLNVPGIVGFGAACGLMLRGRTGEASRLGILRDKLWYRLQDGIKGIKRNGDTLEQTLPQTLNVFIPGVEAETLRMMVPWIAMSTGSACSASKDEPSHVLKALYPEQEYRWHSSIRLSVGRFTTFEEIDAAGGDIVEAVARARQIKEQSNG